MSEIPDNAEPRKDRIRGGFPGGPSRPTEGEPAPRWHIRTVEEIESGITQRRMRRRQGKRQARLFWGLVAVMGLAGAVGLGIGRMSRQTQEGLTEAAQAREQQDDFISREVNRTLLNLWKMEDIEAVRNQGRAR